jgi:tetratricopeptide (TPR) repeat protein
MARIVLCFSLCAYFALVTRGWAQEPQDLASRAFSAGSAAYAEADYLRALAFFQDARDAGIQGPAVHYNIAVCHYRLGDYPAADSEFSLIAERYPAMRELAQYNLGLVAQRQGDDRAAERHFRQALENSQDESIQRLAASQLSPEPVVAPSRWYGRLNTRLGYDDNVRLLSDAVPIPSDQSADSLSTEFWGLISGPLSQAPGFRFDGSLYSVRYQDASFYDQDYLRLGAVYRWQWGDWLAEAGPQLSLSTLDGDGYEERGGLAFRVKRNITSELAFKVRYTHDEVDAGDARFAFVEGPRDWLELSLDRGDADNRLTFSYALESNDRGVNIASTRHKFSLRYRYSFNARWEADVQGSFRRSSYDDLAQPRDEDLTELSLDLTRNLPQNWAVNGFLSVSDNSSVEPFAYDRSRFSLSISKVFY